MWLLRGAGHALTHVTLEPSFIGSGRRALGDAAVAALLANAPPGLESLAIHRVGELTDAAFAGCRPLPTLWWLELRQQAGPLRLTPAGLLALGRALPGLQALDLAPESQAREGVERAWVEQLDALFGGAARASSSLLAAIRSALDREAAAAAAAVAGALSGDGGGGGGGAAPVLQ
jgi:hypothetical protein